MAEISAPLDYAPFAKMTDRQKALIMTLYATPGLNAQELAELLVMPVDEVQADMARLEKMGLVKLTD